MKCTTDTVEKATEKKVEQPDFTGLLDQWLEMQKKAQVKTQEEMGSGTNEAGTVGQNYAVYFCRRCGEKLFEDSAFCHKCGTSIVPQAEQRQPKDLAQTLSQQKQHTQTPQASQISMQSQARKECQQQVATQPKDKVYTQKRAKDRSKILKGILIAILMLGAVLIILGQDYIRENFTRTIDIPFDLDLLYVFCGLPLFCSMIAMVTAKFGRTEGNWSAYPWFWYGFGVVIPAWSIFARRDEYFSDSAYYLPMALFVIVSSILFFVIRGMQNHRNKG